MNIKEAKCYQGNTCLVAVLKYQAPCGNCADSATWMLDHLFAQRIEKGDGLAWGHVLRVWAKIGI